jgi:hypothetical protein
MSPDIIGARPRRLLRPVMTRWARSTPLHTEGQPYGTQANIERSPQNFHIQFLLGHDLTSVK